MKEYSEKLFNKRIFELEDLAPMIYLKYRISKGLEFDIVIIANANSTNYPANELDIKLLYVSMTRPLHKLFVLYEDELSPLLKNVKALA